MNDDFISDRTLERLALGELPDDDAQRVLARLEAKGELERFEALITDNDAFFETYPPHVLAARIRQDARPGAPALTHKETTMLVPSRLPVLATIVAAMVGIAALAWMFSTSADLSPPVAPPPIAAPTPPRAPIGPTEPVAPDAPEPRSEGLAWVQDRDARYPLPPAMYMQTEQIVPVDAKGLVRVTFSNTSIVNAVAADDLVYLTARAPGTTMVRLIGPDDEVVSSILTVGEPIEPETLKSAVEGEHSVYACAVAAPQYAGVARITVVASAGGVHMGHAVFPGLNDADAEVALRRCVEQTVAKWDIRPIPLSVGKVNFNFGAGAVCTPGEDC